MDVHMISRRTGYNLTACGIRCLSYNPIFYMDMFGEAIEVKQTWEGVTCQQCLKENVNSASTTVTPSA